AWDETKKSYYTESLRVPIKLLKVVSVEGVQKELSADHFPWNFDSV
nr:hypothetical protein [Tanacetum cinerariifolium]